MMWLGSPEFKVGALVVLVTALIGGMALKVAEGPNVFGAKKLHFTVDNAGGLVKNSAVKMAGIKVGVIKDIILKDGKAKVIVALDHDVQVSPNSQAQLKADGILGDKHVELVPGEPSDSRLGEGDEIKNVSNKGGLDDIMDEAGRVARNMNELLDVLKKATKEGDDSSVVGRTVLNLEKLTADIREMTSRNKDKIGNIIDHFNNIAKNVDTYINEESLARIDRSLKNIEDITGKLSRGEGTLGRLINDDQTVDALNEAIGNVNKFLGGAEKMETSVDFHSEFMQESSLTKSYLGLKIQPGLDRYYLIQLIDDPLGVKRSVHSETTSGGVTSTEDNTTTYKNKIKLTALFAKNFWDFTIKGGLIENFGGVGLDYHLFSKKLTLSAEFFNFTELQVRTFAKWNFFKGVYFTVGGDNILSNDERHGSAFVGAGIFITNDDLKMLASKMAF